MNLQGAFIALETLAVDEWIARFSFNESLAQRSNLEIKLTKHTAIARVRFGIEMFDGISGRG